MSVPAEYHQIDPGLAAVLRGIREEAQGIHHRPFTHYRGERHARPTIHGARAAHLATQTQDYLPHLLNAAQLRGMATSTFPSEAGAYMNPYQERVSNRISELGNRNLTEKVLPALEAKFVRLGQHGGKHHAELASRAARDIQKEISEAQGQALHQGYRESADIYNQDKVRAMEAARLETAIAQAVQAGRMTDMEALMRMDALERAREQEKLDLDYQEHLREQMHPLEMLNFYNMISSRQPYNHTVHHYGPSPRTSMQGRDYAGMAAGIGLRGLGRALGFKKGGHAVLSELRAKVKP